MKWLLLELLLICLKFISVTVGVAPNIDYSNNMRVLKLPKNTKNGTIIYRLKGSDPDPEILTFGVEGDEANNLLLIKSAGYTEADVVLKSTLEKEKYSFIIYVTDGKETTKTDASIIVTETDSVPSPFLDVPPVIVVPENTPTNASIGFILAKEMDDSNLAVKFEIRGSDSFAIRYVFGPRGTSKAEILLIRPVDYERKNIYPLTILAMNAWKNTSIDTRNVATTSLVVVVSDVQDTPPQFTSIPSVVQLSESLKPGDLIFKVSAEDYDFGNPRDLSYQILQNVPWTSFFRIDYVSGEIFLEKSVSLLRSQYSDSMPILITIKAKEVGPSSGFPAMEVEAQVAIVVVNTENHPPKFEATIFSGTIPENSPLMTSVTWDEGTIPVVKDPDQGSNGTFLLYVEDQSGIFGVTPSKANGEAMFYVVVKYPSLLDYDVYEKEPVTLKIIAKEVNTPQRFTSSALIRIKVTDVNDNFPQFSQAKYVASIPEKVKPGTPVITIKATDKDHGSFGDVVYKLRGAMAKNFNIDSGSGEVTVLSDEGFDRERASEYVLTVEAIDEKGMGNINSTQLVVELLDTNDNAPVFSQPRYDAVLQSDCQTFYDNLIIRAFDADEMGPNSNLTYEILNGNYQEKFSINNRSGEIRLREPLTKTPSLNGIPGIPPITLTVRAHDHGFPALSSSVQVHIHGEEYLNRTINFIVPFQEQYVKDRLVTFNKGLSEITGTPANILSVNKFNTSDHNSLVEAWIAYPLTTTVNVTNLDQILSRMLRGDKSGLSYEKEGPPISGAKYATVFWILIVLVILIVFFIICCCCYFCCVRLIGNKLKKEMSRVTPQDKIIILKENQDGHESVKNAWEDDNETWVYSNGRLLKKHQQAFTPGVETEPKETEAHRDRRGSPRSNITREPLRLDDRPVYAGANLRLDPHYEREGAQTVSTEYVLQDGRRGQGEGRQQNGYIVVRRNLDDFRRRDRRGVDDRIREPRYNEYPDPRPPEPRRTEIMYIRSPPKESRYDRPYPEEQFLPRSVSETDLYHTQQRAIREYEAEQRSHSLNSHSQKPKAKAQQPVQPNSLRFSRHHAEPPYGSYRDSETSKIASLNPRIENSRDSRWQGPSYHQDEGGYQLQGGRNLNVITTLGHQDQNRVSPVAFERAAPNSYHQQELNGGGGLRVVAAVPVGQFATGSNRYPSNERRDYPSETVRDYRNQPNHSTDYQNNRNVDYPNNPNRDSQPNHFNNQNNPPTDYTNNQTRDFKSNSNREYLNEYPATARDVHTNHGKNNYHNPNQPHPGDPNVGTVVYHDYPPGSPRVHPNSNDYYHNNPPIIIQQPSSKSSRERHVPIILSNNPSLNTVREYSTSSTGRDDPRGTSTPRSPQYDVHELESNRNANAVGAFHDKPNNREDVRGLRGREGIDVKPPHNIGAQRETELINHNGQISNGPYSQRTTSSRGELETRSSTTGQIDQSANRPHSPRATASRGELETRSSTTVQIDHSTNQSHSRRATTFRSKEETQNSTIGQIDESSNGPNSGRATEGESQNSTPKERYSTPLDHIEQYLVPINNGSRTSPTFDNGTVLDSNNLCDESKLEKRAIVEHRDGHVFIIETDRPLADVDTTTNDDDSDSGIGGPYGSLKLKKGSYLEKKSVFTIAYDGMQTQKLKSSEGRHISP